jgi:hypothetical protein
MEQFFSKQKNINKKYIKHYNFIKKPLNFINI